MAEEKDKLPKVDNDIGKLLEDLDIEDIEGIDENSRKPETPKDIAIEIVKDSLTDTNFIEENLVNKVLPDSIVVQKDIVKNVKDEILDTVDKEFGEIKSVVGKLAEKADDIVPDRFGKVKSILKKLKPESTSFNTTIEKTDSEKASDVVSRDLESSVVLERASYVSQLIDQVVRSKTDLTTQQIQKQQAIDIAKLTRFHLTFTASYQRKSLELKYRNVLILKDILVNLINFSKAFSVKLDQIVKNTALPEYVKLRSSEAIKEQLRRDIATSTVKGFRGNKSISERLAVGFRNKIRNFTEGIKTGLSVPLELIETSSTIDDLAGYMGGGINPKLSIAGSMGLGFIVGNLVNRIRGRIEEKLNKKGHLSRLERFTSNLQSGLEQFATGGSEDENSLTKTLRRVSRVLVDTIKEEDKDINIRISDMTPERVRLYDIRSKVSLVEVIPGYLARILKEIIYLGRGVGSDLVVYDYNSRKFIDRGKLGKELKKTLVSDKHGISISKNIVKDITRDKKVDQKVKDNLAAILADLSIKGYGIDNIEKSTVYRKLPELDKKKIKRLLENVVKDDRKVVRLNRSIESIGSNIPVPDEWIKDIVDIGQKDVLLDTGIVREKDNKLELDKDKYLQWLFREDRVSTRNLSNLGSAIDIGSSIKDTSAANMDVSGSSNVRTSSTTTTKPTETPDTSSTRSDRPTSRTKRLVDRYIKNKINKLKTINRLTGGIGGKLLDFIRKRQDTNKLVQPTITNTQNTYTNIKRQLVADEAIDPIEKDKLITGIETNEKLDILNVRTEALNASIEKIVENTKPKKELRFKDELERFKRRDSKPTKPSKDKVTKEKKPNLIEKILKSIGGIGAILTKGFSGVVDKLVSVVKSLSVIGMVAKTLGSIRGSIDIGRGKKKGIVNKTLDSVSNVTRKADKGVIKSIGRGTGKLVGKLVGKRIPIVGLGLGAMYAADRFQHGDLLGSAGELVSGALSTIPGIGTGASMAIDGLLASRDIGNVKSSLSDQIDGILKADNLSPALFLRRLKNAAIYGVSNGISVDEIRSTLVDKLQSTYNIDKKKISVVVDYIILASTTEVRDGKILPPEEGILTIAEQILANKETINLLDSKNPKNTLSKMLVSRIKDIMGKVVSSIKETNRYFGSGNVASSNIPYSGRSSNISGNVVDYRNVNSNILQQAKGPIDSGDVENRNLDGQKSKTVSEGIVDPTKIKRIPYDPRGKIPILETPMETPDGGLSAINKRNANIEGLNPVVLKNFLSMAKEYFKLTGKKINVNSAFRSYQDQLRISRSRGGYAARPGRSLHEYGLAIDINTKDADELDRLGLFRKYGFIRPLSGETWHIEPAMIQFDIGGVKKDPNLASKLAEESVGRGGSGLGAIVRRKPIHRSLEITKKIIEPSSSLPIKLEDIAKDTLKDVENANLGIGTGTIPDTTDITVDTSKDIVPVSNSAPIEKAIDVGKTLKPATPTNVTMTAETISTAIEKPQVQNTAAIDAIVNFSTVTMENLPKMTETLLSVDDTLKASLEIQKEILQLLKDRPSSKKETPIPTTRQEIPIKNTDSPAISLGKRRSF